MSCLALWGAVDVGDLIGIVVVLLIMFFSALWQWLIKSAEMARRMQPPAARPNPPAEPPRNDGLDAEIDEFLRRSAQRRGGHAAAPAPPSAAPPSAPSLGGEPPVQAEVIREKPVGAEVIEHVEQYLDTGEFSQRSTQLGGEVLQADTQFGAHLRQAFDHEVSRLAEKPGEAAAPPTADDSVLPAADQLLTVPATAAGDLAALLGDVDSIRRAIVVNELLRRPEERWG